MFPQDISRMLSLAAGAIQELSKNEPSGDIVEYMTKDFVKTVEVSTIGPVCVGVSPLVCVVKMFLHSCKEL